MTSFSHYLIDMSAANIHNRGFGDSMRRLHRMSPTGTYKLHLQYWGNSGHWTLVIEECEMYIPLHPSNGQWLYRNGLPFKRSQENDIPEEGYDNLEDGP